MMKLQARTKIVVNKNANNTYSVVKYAYDCTTRMTIEHRLISNGLSFREAYAIKRQAVECC